jgi:hypothetical protein
MAHNRKLVLGGMALTMARIPAHANARAANQVRDELEQELVSAGYLHDAPFTWVSVIIRYGLMNETIPHYEPINKEHGDLPVAIEIDVHRLLNVSEKQIAQVYRDVTLRVLIHVGVKYSLPVDRLKALRDRSASA